MKTENVVRIGQLAETLKTLGDTQRAKTHQPDQENNQFLPDLVTELRAIFVAETGENPWAKPIEDISEQHLHQLSDTYIGEEEYFIEFNTFWLAFLMTKPEPDQMVKLLKQLKDWGYVLDDESGLG
ncbi:hypothetical protein EXU85_16185 [Spirosoma sp. KCTC 42546]|uniref:hypothetical protein n=1 Tax=Spirosoma sp. KCTC 42546 TaxID=2520506 RepID=UPI001159472B|nr:hypothetical protein [Spirosoma sp. KCTC 42546]QDK80063.1 hypothetical protein EXU85_16185 [Spirosoma sp. KCTC 42546]